MPVISTNTAANTALRYLNQNSDQQSSNLARIASGSRITKASDDASGLAIGTKLQTDVSTLSQAQTNAANGASILSVADGGMSSISDILSRMKTLATQSVSGTVTDTERAYIQAEIDELALEITSIATATSFNGESLLDGTSDYATGVVFMAGTESTDTLTVTIANVDATALAVNAPDVETDAASRTAALASIDAAINTLSTARANVGAQMSRFEFRESMLATSLENTDAAASAINDETDTSGVQASVLKVSDGSYMLVLSTSETGQTIELTDADGVAQSLGIVDGTGAFTTELQAAQNAIVTIDGVTVESSSNTIEDVLTGIDINLYAATPGATITVEIEPDYASVREAIEAFVSAYNTYREFALANQTVGSDGTIPDTAVLFGDSILRTPIQPSTTSLPN